MKKSTFIFYWFCLFFFILNVSCNADTEKIYVSPKGKDSNSGKLFSPVANIDEALSRAQKIFRNNRGMKVEVLLANGNYYLKAPLIINEDIVGDKSNELSIRGRGSSVSITGGEPLEDKKWRKVADTENGSIWSYQLSEGEKTRQLFKNDIRLKRSSSPYLKTEGPAKNYVDRIKRFDFVGINLLKNETLEPFCSFVFKGSDLADLDDWGNAEVIVHHSWESSWHEIAKVDNEHRTIYLTNAFRYPVGFFSTELSYRVENSRDYFTEPGTWMFDSNSQEILYYASKGEGMEGFVVPRIQEVLQIVGKKNQPIKNISFSNIQFSHTTYPWGVNEVESRLVKSNEAKYSWMNFTKGYSGSQTAPRSGQAIVLEYTSQIKFEDCTFSNFGAYAIKIGRGAKETYILENVFHGNGSGAILVGMDVRNVNPNSFPKVEAASNNVIKSNRIHDNGVIHPSGVGIAIMHSYENLVENNVIYNMPYSGISMGWTWNDGLNYTKDNALVNNEIYNVMQLLADGGGIYTLGNLNGCRIINNKIYNLIKSKHAVGATINGIFFDQGSSEVIVEGNQVNGIEGQLLKYNKANQKSILLLNNSLDGN
ncbi:right-handed parallel beta-helix repeat-containing protein [Algoriphagus sp. NG3]|uniref:right-handed parallel beta-helix repeat-containing protein n=1 Tax=Algoriphagus sp. NG3 TaxID=3097546 RepID=UPI002A832E1A|nr:right-handed parallel beta-helix repeat-containing protein [Algoriphagus sp. NG3]WPR77511.1 right-handed parallel beta-helix repeat-containing protein [Algoriphagus sp. NG3]